MLRRPTENSATPSLSPDLKTHDTFHVYQVKAFEECGFKGVDKRRQLPSQLTRDLEYEVSRILDLDFKFGIQFYLVAFNTLLFLKPIDSPSFSRSESKDTTGQLPCSF